MHIPLTPRRLEITKLFDDHDIPSLVRLGLTIVEGPNKNTDCGNYVASRLGLPAQPTIIAAFARQPTTPHLHDGNIVIYKGDFGHGEVIRHYGLGMNGKVISKWGHGEVIIHDITDIPAEYGTSATIHVVTHDLILLAQELMMGGGHQEY